MMQESIPENVRGRVNGVERSLINIANLSAFGIPAIFHKPEQFQENLLFSYVTLTLALVSYLFWYVKKRHEFEKIREELLK